MIGIAYARFSSDQQREESIDAQLAAIRGYACSHGITIVREYTDEARSATSDKRPAFQQMFSDLPTLQPDYVIVHKFDRFSRDRYDSAFYKRQIKKSGAKLISVLEPLDDSPESVILESVLEGMAEYYSKNLARETMKGLTENAKRCRFTGGSAPLGYTIQDGAYVVDQDEAETVRTIFSLYASGKPYSEILSALSGKTTRFGRPFQKTSLNSILHNERYIGTYTFGIQHRKNHNSHRRDPEAIRIYAGIPRIIDDDTWTLCQERLSASSRNAAHRAKRCYLLSGKLFCASCGSPMIGATSTNDRGYEYSYYVCACKQRKQCSARNIPAKTLEGEILDIIGEELRPTSETIAWIMEQIASDLPAENYRQELATVDQKISRLLQYMEKTDFDEDISNRYRELKAKKIELTRKIGSAQDAPVTTEDITSALKRYCDIKSLTREEQKDIINRCVDKIKITETLSEITFRLPKVAGGCNLSYRKFTICKPRYKL